MIGGTDQAISIFINAQWELFLICLAVVLHLLVSRKAFGNLATHERPRQSSIRTNDLFAEEAPRQMQIDEAGSCPDIAVQHSGFDAHCERLQRDRHYRGQARHEVRQAGGTPSIEHFNKLISNFALASSGDGRLQQVWQVVDDMKAVCLRPNKRTCRILLSCLSARSPSPDVRRVMELVRGIEEVMDEVFLTHIVAACTRCMKPMPLTSVLDELHDMISSIPVMSAHTFGAILQAHGIAKDAPGAWRCWRTMRLRDVEPTSIAIGCMVDAVVSNGDVDRGYNLLCQLLSEEKSRPKVNDNGFNAVLKVFGRSRRMDRVMSVLQHMRAQGVQPSVVTFNILINACVLSNRMDIAPQFMADMRANGFAPDIITYGTLIKGYCSKGDVRSAMVTLQKVRQTPEMRPNEIVYNTLLEGCSQGGFVKEADRVLIDMDADGIQPNNQTVVILVEMFGNSRLPGRAIELVEHLTSKFRLEPNAQVYNALLRVCVANSRFASAAETLERMVARHILPSSLAVQNLVRSALASGNISPAVTALRAAFGIPARKACDASNQTGEEKGGIKGLRGVAVFDDLFLGEVLAEVIKCQDVSKYLAGPLLADLRTIRPHMLLDARLEQQILAQGEC